MGPRAIFNVLVALGAVVAIVLVAGPRIDFEDVANEAGQPRDVSPPLERADAAPAEKPRKPRQALPENPEGLSLLARMVRRMDRRRSGSAARDLDYFVIRRDIIDFEVNYGAHLRSGPRPRIFLLERGEPFRAIG